ncbi:MAG: hypothetical protein ACYC9D_00730 [Candidatus Dormibacteria bacterium]
MNIMEFLRERAREYPCPVCSRNLENCGVRLLRKSPNHQYTVQVTCPTCRVSFVVILQFEGMDAEAAAPSSMAPPAEPISTDEVLDVRGILANFDGAFRDLLAGIEHIS